MLLSPDEFHLNTLSLPSSLFLSLRYYNFTLILILKDTKLFYFNGDVRKQAKIFLKIRYRTGKTIYLNILYLEQTSCILEN